MKSTRMSILAIAGVGLIVGSAWAAAQWLQARSASAAHEQMLQQVRAAQHEVEQGRESELLLRARMLAADTAASAYIADAIAVAATPGQAIDTASISDLLAERRTQLGLDAIGVIDTAGRWVAGTRPWTDSGGTPAGHPLYRQAHDQQQLALGLVREEQRVYLATIQPMLRAGAVDAYWYAASELDASFVARIAALAPVDLALYARDAPTQLVLAPGTVTAERWAALVAELGPQPIVAARALDHGAASALPLFASATAVLLLQPNANAAAPTDITIALASLAALWSLLWLALLGWCWRALLMPIGTACDLLERAAMGDFHLRAPAWPTGVRGRFAAAFDALMLRLGAR